jgi:anti-sigma regulatory factor (Ser/Thr protein kinase)
MAKELILFQEHHITSREKVASRLRELAGKIEDTTFLLGDHEVALPEAISFKIEADYEKEQGHSVTELEFELRWQPWAEMPAIAKEIGAN